jgi:fucose permease
VPNPIVSFIAVALEGFFLGPLFPAAIVAATKLLPQHLHVSAIGFSAAVGASGACLIPFAVGAIAQLKGVQVLMPIVLAFLVVDVAIWACLPSFGNKKEKSEFKLDIKTREGENGIS